MHRIRGLIVILFGGALLAVSGIILFSMFQNDTRQEPSMQTGTITMNIVTGTIISGDLESEDEADSTQTGALETQITLRLAMPERMYSDQFDDFLYEFQESQDIIIETVLAEELYSYQQILANEFLQDPYIDIALVPSDRTDSFKQQGLALYIPPASRGLFHVSFYDLFTDQTATYIPFAIDPLLTVIHSGRRDESQEMTLGRLYTRSLTNNTSQELISLLIGLRPNDRTLLQKGRESYPGQYLTITEMLKAIISEQDEIALQQLIDIANSSVPTARNYATMRTRTTQQEQNISGCTTHPIGCLLGQNRGQVALASTSDLLRRSENIASFIPSSYKLYPLPHMTEYYPVRLWGWYINKDSQHRELLGQLLNSYIEKNQNQTLTTPGLLISPFLTTQAEQKKKRELREIREREFDREPIVASLETQMEFMQKLGRDFLFEGNIDPTLRLYQKRNIVGR